MPGYTVHTFDTFTVANSMPLACHLNGSPPAVSTVITGTQNVFCRDVQAMVGRGGGEIREERERLEGR